MIGCGRGELRNNKMYPTADIVILFSGNAIKPLYLRSIRCHLLW